MSNYIQIRDYPGVEIGRFVYKPNKKNPEELTVKMPDESGNSSHMYFKTPVMLLGNIDCYNGDYYLDLHFQDSDQDFKDMINIIDIHHISQVHSYLTEDQNSEQGDAGIENKENQTEKTMPVSVVEQRFIPSIKKSGYTFDDCLKLCFKANSVQFFDQTNKQIPIDLVQRDYFIQGLLHLEGVKKSGDQYYTSWKPLQFKVKIPEELWENCEVDVKNT